LPQFDAPLAALDDTRDRVEREIGYFQSQERSRLPPGQQRAH